MRDPQDISEVTENLVLYLLHHQMKVCEIVLGVYTSDTHITALDNASSITLPGKALQDGDTCGVPREDGGDGARSTYL